VANIISAWLVEARITPRVTACRVGGVDVFIASASRDFPLFGELVVQAFSVIASARSVLMCDGCGELFAPERPRAPRRRKFCPECGPKAAWRESKRRKRAEARQRSM
jgi:hypothetical protein